jgi:hypothetical protein
MGSGLQSVRLLLGSHEAVGASDVLEVRTAVEVLRRARFLVRRRRATLPRDSVEVWLIAGVRRRFSASQCIHVRSSLLPRSQNATCKLRICRITTLVLFNAA